MVNTTVIAATLLLVATVVMWLSDVCHGALVLMTLAMWVIACGSLWIRLRRIRSLIDIATRFGEGDWRARAELGRSDDLAHLGRALNLLGERLHVNHEAMQRQRMVLESILSSLTEGIACVDALDRTRYSNAAWRQLANGGGDDTQQAWYESLSNPSVLALVDSARKGIEDAPVQVMHRRRHLQVSAVPAGDDAVVIVLRDRSAIERIEQQRRELFTALSHELKTPLTAIVAASDTLAATFEEPIDRSEQAVTMQRDLLTRIDHHAQRLSALIHDVLHLAHNQHGGWQAMVQPCDLAPLLRSIVDEQRGLAERNAITIRFTMPTAIPVISDPELLRHIFSNLVSNALRYNRNPGTVTIRVLAPQHAAITVEVADTGIGIPAEHHDRLFTPFFRVDPARSRATGGTGLGLSIVKQLCTVLNADIAITSSSAGTTATVRLPVHSDDIDE